MRGKSTPKEISPEDDDSQGFHLSPSMLTSPNEVSTASMVSVPGEAETDEPLRRRLDLRSLSEGVAALVFPSVGNTSSFSFKLTFCETNLTVNLFKCKASYHYNPTLWRGHDLVSLHY